MVEVLDKEKPKDPKMLQLLQEFLYIVCTRGFTPIFKRVGSKDNHLADFLSRNHDDASIAAYLKLNPNPMHTRVEAPDHLFSLRSNW